MFPSDKLIIKEIYVDEIWFKWINYIFEFVAKESTSKVQLRKRRYKNFVFAANVTQNKIFDLVHTVIFSNWNVKFMCSVIDDELGVQCVYYLEHEILFQFTV